MKFLISHYIKLKEQPNTYIETTTPISPRRI